MSEHKDQEWQRLCAELGRIFGEMVTLQRVVAERDAEIVDLRRQLAAAQDQLQRPDEPPAVYQP